jgi:hypothetical protein
VRITYDLAKRETTLAERGLDFNHAPQVFAGPHLDIEDDRQNYGETRWQTIGRLNERMVMVVWTQRGEDRHIISMRKCNDREQERYLARLGGP